MRLFISRKEKLNTWSQKNPTQFIADVCIYPTSPHKQDATQGQFFIQSLIGLNSELSLS